MRWKGREEIAKTDMRCGDGLRVSSGGARRERTIKVHWKGPDDASNSSPAKAAADNASARDEENCRDDTSTDKAREEILNRLESF